MRRVLEGEFNRYLDMYRKWIGNYTDLECWNTAFDIGKCLLLAQNKHARSMFSRQRIVLKEVIKTFFQENFNRVLFTKLWESFLQPIFYHLSTERENAWHIHTYKTIITRSPFSIKQSRVNWRTICYELLRGDTKINTITQCPILNHESRNVAR